MNNTVLLGNRDGKVDYLSLMDFEGARVARRDGDGGIASFDDANES